MESRRLPPLAVFGFLMPNLVGFLAFTMLPVILSFVMAFTSWSLKPAVPLEFVGARNLVDVLGVRAVTDGAPGLCWGYGLAALILTLGLVGALWANMAQWRGTRLGGGLLALTGIVAIWLTLRAVGAPLPDGGKAPLAQGPLLAGLLAVACGLFVLLRDGDIRPGLGALPASLVAGGALALSLLHPGMWTVYEPRDLRFWQYFYNTVYLMLGIPFGIGGALGLALLVNNELKLTPHRIGITPALVLRVFGCGLAVAIGLVLALSLPGVAPKVIPLLGCALGVWAVARVASDVALPRVAGALFCVAGGLATLLLSWAWNPNIALLGSILWGMVALGIAFDVVSFRTVYYLPSFTAGVALMILWKALYNPETGPINAGLSSLFGALHLGIKPPEWLSSVAWAKPALMIMGIWTGIGGTNMLLYLAGLSSVPTELLDAADVDGATTWQRFRHVTWPQLAPTTFFISIMSIIGGLQGGFDQARVMTGGGPAGSTTTLSFYIYNKAFQDLDLGYAAAISWVLFAIIFVATAINWRFGRELEVGP